MDFQTLMDALKQSPAIAVLAVVIILYKDKLKVYDKHLSDCETLPKVLIASKLEAISEQLRVLHTRITTHREETKLEVAEIKRELLVDIEKLDKSYHDFKNEMTGHLLKLYHNS